MTNRTFIWCLLTLAGIAALLIGFGRTTDIDLLLADTMYDAATQSFPWREHWLAANFMHHFMKALLIGIGLTPFVILLADLAMGKRLLTPRNRRALLVISAAAILIPLAISTTKAMSIHHCPWGLERYGGVAPYLRIFDSLPAGVSPGHCFPAGHASSGLWLTAVAVFWLPQRPGRALAVFGLALIPGLLLGWFQQLRGAHFLTHTLWSVWIAALITLVLIRLALPPPRNSASADQATLSPGSARP